MKFPFLKRLTLRKYGKFCLYLALCLCFVLVIETIVKKFGLLTTFQDQTIDSEDDEIETNWKWHALRQNLLKRNRVSKVVVMAYARGGSTLISDIFNIDANSTVLWYEALHGFHSYYSGLPQFSSESRILFYNNFTRKSLNNDKLNALTAYLYRLLTLNASVTPIETLVHNVFMGKSAAFRMFSRCMALQDAFKTFVKCQMITMLHCHFRDLYNYYKPGEYDPLSFNIKCEDILQSLRRMNLSKYDGNTTRHLIVQYAKDNDRIDLISLVTKSACKLSSDTLDQVKLRYMMRVRQRKETPICKVVQKFHDIVRNQLCVLNVTKTTFHCRRQIEKLRAETNLVVAQIHRAFIGDLETIIKRVPDIHVVHYVRDPRAIAVSRAEKNYHTFKRYDNWSAVDETKVLCTKMRDDLKASRRLQQIYPDSVITVRYEDLVRYPTNTVTEMYDYFGRPVPTGLDQWVNRTMNAAKDNGMYGVQRTNSTQHLSSWRSIVSEKDLLQMNKYCDSVIREFGYDYDV